MAARKPKWYPPPPPSPKILHLPRRTCRRSRASKPPIAGKVVVPGVGDQEIITNALPRGRLESLFDRERAFSRSVPVILLNSGDGDDRDRGRESGSRQSEEEVEGEKWKFQAEFLRAECNFLRMEREVALKKLERNRTQMEKTLQSAVQALILGRKKMFESKNAGPTPLEEEIEELERNLADLQKNSHVRDHKTRRCCNFDKKASILRRHIEKLETISEERKCVREIREMAEASLRIDSSCDSSENHILSNRRSRLNEVEMIRRKMEGLSKGMLERIEEYGNVLCSSSSCSSVSAWRRIEFPETETQQEKRCGEEEEKGPCGGRCRAIVRKIAEQVRSEAEQWSQMQVMLGQVREEMEELQASRDLWQNRAVESHDRFLAVQTDMHEWRRRARLSEAKVSELEKKVGRLQVETERAIRTSDRRQSVTPEIPPDIENAWGTARIRDSDRVAADSQKENEKRVLVCRLREKPPRRNEEEGDRRKKACSCGTLPKRLPLQELGNSSSPWRRQSSSSVFPSHSSSHPPSAGREEG